MWPGFLYIVDSTCSWDNRLHIIIQSSPILLFCFLRICAMYHRYIGRVSSSISVRALNSLRELLDEWTGKCFSKAPLAPSGSTEKGHVHHKSNGHRVYRHRYTTNQLYTSRDFLESHFSVSSIAIFPWNSEKSGHPPCRYQCCARWACQASKQDVPWRSMESRAADHHTMC